MIFATATLGLKVFTVMTVIVTILGAIIAWATYEPPTKKNRKK